MRQVGLRKLRCNNVYMKYNLLSLKCKFHQFYWILNALKILCRTYYAELPINSRMQLRANNDESTQLTN